MQPMTWVPGTEKSKDPRVVRERVLARVGVRACGGQVGLAGSHSHHSQVCHRVEFVPGALGSRGRVLGRAAVEADLCFHITFVSVDCGMQGWWW